MAGQVFITGDCHADFHKFTTQAFPEQTEMDKDDYVVICGDFGGIWDYEQESKNEQYWLSWLDNKPYTTLFVDGNHENFDRLNNYPVKEWHGGLVHEIRPSVLHLMRGEVYDIEGRKFFAFGGASSHDISDGIIPYSPKWKQVMKQWSDDGKYAFRVDHVSWWKEELPSQTEMNHAEANLAKCDYQVDYVISHCAPTYITALMGFKNSDILTNWFMHLVYEKNLQFSNWIFGHYHMDKRIDDKYICLYDQIIKIA